MDPIRRKMLKTGAAATVMAAAPRVLAQQAGQRGAAMSLYEKGPVRIHYEEAGSGFPLLLIAGGGLNSTISGLANPFNPIEEFKGEYRCIASDLRNAARVNVADARIRSVVVMVTLLCACQRDYRFHTVAVYEAPRGGYSIRIDCKGIVRAGHDISEQASGVISVSPSDAGPAGPAPMTVEVTRRDSRVQFGNDLLPGGSEPDPSAVVVSGLLVRAGYSVYRDELEEFASAIEGVMAGPKGTPMPGQTRALKVVSITFGR